MKNSTGFFNGNYSIPGFGAIKFKFRRKVAIPRGISDSLDTRLTLDSEGGEGEIFVAEIQRYKVSTKRPGNIADPL